MNEPSPSVPLQTIARETLLRYGFLVETPPPAQAELSKITEPDFSHIKITDLSDFLWSSIDNDDSRDLDQIEYLKPEGSDYRLYIGIADVATLVPKGSSLDQAAEHNTTSLYTGIRTFPLFPEKLSTNLTSLVENEKRLAMVIEMRMSASGETLESTIYPALVQNRAQLTYNGVAA
jgi:exoribonuclease-2